MSNTASRGATATVAAFSIWGLFPLYWKMVGHVPPLQVLAHRGVWCAVAVWAVLLLRGDFAWVARITRRQLGLLTAGALLITGNWGVYVWAVIAGHIVETSLGYFITPLVNVLLAVAVFRERLTPAQRVAVCLAALGVALLAWRFGQPPWIALALAVSFGLYGLVRKLAAFDPVHGLAVESGLMVAPAVLYLLWCAAAGQGHFLVGEPLVDLLLVVGGPVTAIPLALFAYGAQRVSMLSLGVMQYIAPMVQLLIGVLVYHEPFGGARAVAFACIWAALLVFTGEALWRYRMASGAARPVAGA